MSHSTLKRTLFLVSHSTKLCGVEAFARDLAMEYGKLGYEPRILPISGRPSDWIAIWKALADVDALAINFPLVAWKKVLLTPLAALIFALLRGKPPIIVLHEWSDLDWRRRTILGIYALFASRLQFSSPSVRSQFLANRLMVHLAPKSSLVPIPSNIEAAPPTVPSPFAARIREERTQGKMIIGHFGSIYPKKQSDFVLDVAVELKRLGLPCFLVFIGSFIKGADRVEEEFYAKAQRLGLGDDILVSGYVDEAQSIHALFEEVDCFVYRFREGLSSRRGSVLACLQSQKLAVVNAPRDSHEFDHHRIYRLALGAGSLRLLETNATPADYAKLLASRPSFEPLNPALIFEQGWREAACAFVSQLDGATANATASTATTPGSP